MTTQYNLLLNDIITTIVFTTIIPGLIYLFYLYDLIVLGTCKLTIVIFFLIFFIGPLIFKFWYALQRQVIFLNYVSWPKYPDYNSPDKYGLNGTRNFYIQTDDGIKLGMWHILPENLIKDSASANPKLNYEQNLKEANTIFIYMHGNSGNRVASHRIELYKVLRKYYHIIAFDYRSYGDSSQIAPTELGVIKDAISVIKWAKNVTNENTKLFVWGHSLGTGISTHALRLLGQENVHVDGLILESPFNNIRSEVGEHPSAMLFKNMPWFKYTIVDPLYENGFRFETDEHIKYINCPILILHAENDLIVPYKLGVKLYDMAVKHRTKWQGFIKFEKFKNFGHKYICRAPELAKIVSNFVNEDLRLN